MCCCKLERRQLIQHSCSFGKLLVLSCLITTINPVEKCQQRQTLGLKGTRIFGGLLKPHISDIPAFLNSSAAIISNTNSSTRLIDVSNGKATTANDHSNGYLWTLNLEQHPSEEETLRMVAVDQANMNSLVMKLQATGGTFPRLGAVLWFHRCLRPPCFLSRCSLAPLQYLQVFNIPSACLRGPCLRKLMANELVSAIPCSALQCPGKEPDALRAS